MSWSRESKWVEKDGVIEAYGSDEHPGVYYVTANQNGGYSLCYWPNKRKTIETVTLLDSFETDDAALAALEDKISNSG